MDTLDLQAGYPKDAVSASEALQPQRPVIYQDPDFPMFYKGEVEEASYPITVSIFPFESQSINGCELASGLSQVQYNLTSQPQSRKQLITF